MKHTFIRNFLACGLTGWCMEIIFTALDSFRRRDMRLMGQTSLWMFPIYGSACFLSLLYRPLKKFPPFFRGCIYAACIHIGEYLTGSFLDKHKICPWNYENSRWNIRRVIRLDYFPNWLLAGLLFEKILSHKKESKAV